MAVIDKPSADLTPAELYAILRLRVDVFVVQKACAYAELDGRDVAPAATPTSGRFEGCSAHPESDRKRGPMVASTRMMQNNLCKELSAKVPLHHG